MLDHCKSILFLSSLSSLFLGFDYLEFLGPVEKGVKGRVEVPPSLLKHQKQQKESLHELLLQEGQFDVNTEVNDQYRRKNL